MAALTRSHPQTARLEPARLPTARSKLAGLADISPQAPKVRVAAASAVAAGGALAAAKLVRDRAADADGRPKAEPFRLTRGESPRDGVRRVARAQLDLTVGLLESTPRDDGGGSVHDARKALKRLRTLVRVSRDAIGDQRYRRENTTFRDVGRALSGTRDAQVLLDTLDGLKSRYEHALRDDAWPRLHDGLSRAAADSRTIGSTRSSTMVGVLIDARERVDTWPLPDNGGPESLASGIAVVYRRGRRACRTAGSEPNLESLHELRKRAKDLWYSAQLLEPVSPKRMKRLKRDAHRLSDLLGEDHDLAILVHHADRHPELLDAGERELLTAAIEFRHQALRLEALAGAAKLYRAKPKKFLARLGLA